MLCTILVNMGSKRSFFQTYVLSIKSKKFFGRKFVTFGFSFLMTMSFAFFGIGCAGLLRDWVISPVKCVWPTIIPTLAINRALLAPERKNVVNGWRISRYRFFFVVMTASFIWYFFPGYIFTALSTFNWITWIAPNNVKLAVITGMSLGLGYNPISTFDWNVIDKDTPLVVPFFSTANKYAGMLLSSFLLIAFQWSNYKWTGYIPINSNSIYDKTGGEFKVNRVLDDNNQLNTTAYLNYSPPYLSAGALIQYGSFYASITCAVTYVLATEWRQIVEALRRIYKDVHSLLTKSARRVKDEIMRDDAFSKAMKNYKDVPISWSLSVFVLSFVFSILGVSVYDTGVPAWIMIVMQIFSLLFLFPSCYLYSTTGTALGFHDMTAIVSGYLVPGNGIAALLCRGIGSATDDQAIAFLEDLKISRYARLPPRAVFRVQIIGTFVGSLVCIGAVESLMNRFEDLCSQTNREKFRCVSSRNFFSDALLYGVIGPRRLFNSLYPELKWCFLVGIGIALLYIFMKHKMPATLRYVHPVLLVSGFGSWGNAYNLSYSTPAMISAFVFMYHIKRHYLGWWTKYNYVLTSGLGAGVAFSALLILLTLQYTNTDFEWWGNLVADAGVDGAKEDGIFEVPKGGFGLKIGEFQ